MTYKLEVKRPAGDKELWSIIGLPGTWLNIETYADVPTPDTDLLLVGLNHACDSPESIVASVHEAIYDHHQVSGGLKAGDVIESTATTVNRFHSYNSSAGTVDVPAMRFVVDGVHVMLLEPSLLDGDRDYPQGCVDEFYGR